jgi:hypothetical protein
MDMGKSQVICYVPSQLSWFDEDEATHIHSFKLIAPALLGAMKEGDKNDPKVPLLAIKDFAALNPQDNQGGNASKMAWMTCCLQ